MDLDVSEELRRMIETNSPKFEALYGCRPDTLIFSPLVAQAFFDGSEIPVLLHGMKIVIGPTPTMIPQLAVHKDNAARQRSLH
ncbi:hypothetical protein [Paraburkholderia acidisoli]|uniref:Uncharacterized protein n=1 Tax=Paraburkholderia acidisoli TaxID=2571748 RepID=A0A7Z2GMP7_9BURK|nr:hypothetical protein [Paraburkholderia acidisoli]QGZ64375.1 hypothetical protein FAZ98_21890 [Paraburkholderia acidisoli]